MGRQFAIEARKRLRFVKNPEVNQYIRQMGERLVSVLESRRYRYRFYVVRNPVLNAFAVPGGYVYIHSGLIQKAPSMHALAGVIGHEIGHVSSRHTAKMIAKSQMLNIAALVAAFLARGQQGAPLAAAAVAQSFQLKYSRDFEREADRKGVFYLYEAGYDPQGLVAFLEMMLREKMVYPTEIPPYLLTHPLTYQRIASLESLIISRRLKRESYIKDDHFSCIQSLVAAETEPQMQIMRNHEEIVREHPSDPEALYRLGIVYKYYKWWRKAETVLRKAVLLKPDHYRARTDLGSVLFSMNRVEEARAELREALKFNADYAEAYQVIGQIHMEEGENEEAISTFKRALQLNPYLSRVHYFLGIEYAKGGERGLSDYHLGLYYCSINERERALDYFQKALKIFGSKSSQGMNIEKEIEDLKNS